MINCDELIERKIMRKVVDRKKGAKWEKTRRKKERGVKCFHSLRAASLVRTRVTAALQ